MQSAIRKTSLQLNDAFNFRQKAYEQATNIHQSYCTIYYVPTQQLENIQPLFTFSTNTCLSYFVEICTPTPDTQPATITNPTSHFIPHNNSINRCRDLVHESTSFQHANFFSKKNISEHPELDLQHRLDAILDRRVSMALFTMSRTQTPYQHRLQTRF